MNLYEFLELNKYPVRDRRSYQESFKAFLKHKQIAPFFDAIMRAASPAALSELKKTIAEQYDKIWSAFEEDFPEWKRREVDDWSHMWDKLCGKRPYTFSISNSVMREGFFFSSHQKIQDLQTQITKLGQKALESERRCALRNLVDSDRTFYSFDEYEAASWSETPADSVGHQNRSLYQWLNYFKYLKSLLGQFKSSLLHSENRKKSLELFQDMEGQELRLKTIETNLSQASIQLVENKKEKARQSCQRTEIIEKRFPYENFRRGSDFSNFKERDRCIAEDPDCMELENKIEELKLDEARIKTVILDESKKMETQMAELSSRFKKHHNYWKNNLPEFFGRYDDIQAMRTLQIGKKSNQDVLFRNITEGEYKNIIAIQQFSQAEGSSYERQKWFYEEGAALGSGTSHPIKCRIFLCPRSIVLLNSLKKENDFSAAVMYKPPGKEGATGEDECIGIHEDALPAFNALIEKVEFEDVYGNKYAQGVRFNREKSLEALVSFEGVSIKDKGVCKAPGMKV